MPLRTDIATELVTIFNKINKVNGYGTNIALAERSLRFFDEIEEWPSIYVVGGSESREYFPGHMKKRFMHFICRAYVFELGDNPENALNFFLDDIENAIETAFFTNRLNNLVHNIYISEITTDEGLLSEDGKAVAEIDLIAEIIIT